MNNIKSSNASSISRRSISVILAAAVILFLPTITSAASLYWTVANGDWSTASNWGGIEPTSLDDAFINNGGTAVITQTGEVCRYFNLGEISTDSGTAQINGGSLNSTEVIIGRNGTGMLSITNGGNVGNSYSHLGYGSGSTGTAIVDGTGSTWINSESLHVGPFGNGILNINNGGKVSNTYCFLGRYSGSTGTVTVDGTGSIWTNSYDLHIGESGNGTLNITNGGSVSCANDTSVGSDPGSTGAINFGTNGGTLTTKGLLVSPSQLTGTGTINTKGLVSDVDMLFDNSHGLAQIMVLNSLPDQNITLNIDMTGTSFTNGAIGAGYKGNASLKILDAKIVNSYSGYFGCHAGSTGTATVDGTGSTWNNSGYLYLGDSGNGILNIINGGNVSNSYGILGLNPGSTGTATVDGAGSSWTNTYLYLGNSGNGTLNITNRGKISNSNGVLGRNTGSKGIANVDGVGSTWTNSGTLTIGNGTMNITNGGKVTNTSCTIGQSSGSSGIVNISGDDSTWTNSSLWLGGNGTGVVNQSGGTNTINGTLTLQSSGSTYNLTGGLLICSSISVGNTPPTFNFGGGTLQVKSQFSTVIPMNMTGINGNATIDTDAQCHASFGGVLSGIGGLNKTGTGALTLQAKALAYSGNTFVKEGTLEIFGGISATGTSLIDIQAGKTVLGRVDVNKPDLHISTAASSMLEIYTNTHSVDTITGTGITQIDAGAVLSVASITQGKLTVAKNAKLIIRPITVGATSHEINPVPEPATISMLAIGLLCIVVYRLRKSE